MIMLEEADPLSRSIRHGADGWLACYRPREGMVMDACSYSSLLTVPRALCLAVLSDAAPGPLTPTSRGISHRAFLATCAEA